MPRKATRRTQAAREAFQPGRASRAIRYQSMAHGTLRVAFPNPEAAQLVAAVLAVDPELRPERCSRTLRQEGGELLVEWSASSDKFLRVAMLSFMDTLSYAIVLYKEARQWNE